MIVLKNKQKKALEFMDSKTVGNIIMPTGSGKSLLIFHNLLMNISNIPANFCISSPRLLLNIQHFHELVSFITDNGLLEKVRFVCVGSEGPGSTIPTKDIMGELIKIKIPYRELIKTSLDSNECKKISDNNINSGLNTIFISTYNSLDKLKDIQLRCFYGDEAHNLITEQEFGKFKDNFQIIEKNTVKKYFFTATVKDLENSVFDDKEEKDLSLFAMNNENIFGERFSVSFKQAMEEDMIVTPKIHFMEPEGNSSGYYRTPENYCRIIHECFLEQEKDLLKHTGGKIGHKLLVKCESVLVAWEIFDNLKKFLPEDIEIYVGSSESPDNRGFSYASRYSYFKSQDEWITDLKKILGIEKKAVILHFDILSEGIDIPSITGVCFLTKNIPSIIKLIQNVGRAQRVLSLDRNKHRGEWIKPYCYVALPFLGDNSSDIGVNAARIRRLRDEYEYCPDFIFSIGNDLGTNTGDLQDLPIDFTQKRKQLKGTKIEKIIQKIEDLDYLYRMDRMNAVASYRRVNQEMWLLKKMELLSNSAYIEESLKRYYLEDPHNIERDGISKNYTPPILRGKIWNSLGDKKYETVLVLYNIEFINDLIHQGYSKDKIYFYCPDDPIRNRIISSFYGCKTFSNLNDALNELNIYGDAIKDKESEMKFDLIISNPPYSSGGDSSDALHLEILNSIINLGKNIIFVQPISWILDQRYGNITGRKYELTYSIKSRIKDRLKSIEVINAKEIFGINLFSELGIVNIIEKNTAPVKFLQEGKIEEYINVNDINKYGNNDLYFSIRDKFKKLSSINNVWMNQINRSKITQSNYVSFSRIRGNPGKDDFYTIIPSKTIPNAEVYKNKAIGFNTLDEANNFIFYLKSKIVRFALSIIKNDRSLNSYELGIIPWLDFTKKYTDSDLCKEFSITPDELEFIYKSIPDYYDEDKRA